MLSASDRGAGFRAPPIWGMIAIASALVCLGGFAAHGFGENGLRLGSELTWRFTVLAYFAAAIAGPVTRLVPGKRLQRLGQERRQLLWGFCASFGVFLASLLVPNTLAPAASVHQGLTAGMIVFAIFGAGLTMVIAYAVSPQPSLGERSRRAILGVGLSYFWLAYTLNGLSHISGPHRPDAFYGFSLVLMMIALLLRFADGFVVKLRGRGGLPQT